MFLKKKSIKIIHILFVIVRVKILFITKNSNKKENKYNDKTHSGQSQPKSKWTSKPVLNMRTKQKSKNIEKYIYPHTNQK